MKRFYNEKLEPDSKFFTLTGKEAHHLKNVMRIKPGETVIFTNGKGLDFKAYIESIENNIINFSVTECIKGEKDSFLNLSIGFSIIKGKKNDELIKPLTELGVTEIIPLVSTRTVSDPGEKKKSNKTARWREISKEAIKQCERSFLPNICEISDFKEIISSAENYDLKILLYERGDISIKTLKEKYNNPKNVLLITGPEGGFTDDEVKAAELNGFEKITMGPRILRAETAVLSSCVVCQHLFGDI
jgi:16S rRNA (uracil1498-N3)-methyltransferase